MVATMSCARKDGRDGTDLAASVATRTPNPETSKSAFSRWSWAGAWEITAPCNESGSEEDADSEYLDDLSPLPHDAHPNLGNTFSEQATAMEPAANTLTQTRTEVDGSSDGEEEAENRSVLRPVLVAVDQVKHQLFNVDGTPCGDLKVGDAGFFCFVKDADGNSVQCYVQPPSHPEPSGPVEEIVVKFPVPAHPERNSMFMAWVCELMQAASSCIVKMHTPALSNAPLVVMGQAGVTLNIRIKSLFKDQSMQVLASAKEALLFWASQSCGTVFVIGSLAQPFHSTRHGFGAACCCHSWKDDLGHTELCQGYLNEGRCRAGQYCTCKHPPYLTNIWVNILAT